MPRPPDQLRPIRVTRRFTSAPGSVLWQQGQTLILCTAAVEAKRPRFFTDDRPGGWVTAEYVMHPASVSEGGGGRKDWPDAIRPDKRGMEIGRLIGRAVRAGVDLSAIGPHTITLDCTVLQADGGTRTSAICGAMVALADALATLPEEMPGSSRGAEIPPHPVAKATTLSRRERGPEATGAKPNTGPEATSGDVSHAPPIPAAFDPKFYKPRQALVSPLAAVSVGIVEGKAVLDLDYALDSAAEVDMNVVRTAGGRYVELQGSAEQGGGFTPEQLAQMLRLANRGIDELLEIQRKAMASG